MATIFGGKIPPKWVMVLVGERLYHRESDGWHEYAAPPPDECSSASKSL